MFPGRGAQGLRGGQRASLPLLGASLEACSAHPTRLPARALPSRWAGMGPLGSISWGP